MNLFSLAKTLVKAWKAMNLLSNLQMMWDLRGIQLKSFKTTCTGTSPSLYIHSVGEVIHEVY